MTLRLLQKRYPGWSIGQTAEYSDNYSADFYRPDGSLAVQLIVYSSGDGRSFCSTRERQKAISLLAALLEGAVTAVQEGRDG